MYDKIVTLNLKTAADYDQILSSFEDKTTKANIIKYYHKKVEHKYKV